jgi:hypothetical protein
MSERRGNITSLTHAQHRLYLFLVALLPDVREKRRFFLTSERRGDIISLTHAQYLLYLFLVPLLPDVREKG